MCIQYNALNYSNLVLLVMTSIYLQEIILVNILSILYLVWPTITVCKNLELWIHTEYIKFKINKFLIKNTVYSIHTQANDESLSPQYFHSSRSSLDYDPFRFNFWLFF